MGSDKIKELENEITELESIIADQSVNGLFLLLQKKYPTKTGAPTATKVPPLTPDECYVFVKNARDSIKYKPLTYGDYGNAKVALNLGWEKIDEAVQHSTKWYRIRAIYAAESITFLILVFTGLVWLVIRGPHVVIFSFVPVEVLEAGATGAVLRYLWFIGSSASNRRYVVTWFPRVFSVPFLGALLSLIVYLAYLAAEMAVGKTPMSFMPDTQTMLISLLAGFGWQETYTGLRGFADQTIGSIFKGSKTS